jgi:hypothetical protein
MRRLVVVALLAALALTLTACGGGGDETTQPAETTQAAAPAEPAADATDEDVEPDRSPPEEQVYEPFPTDPEVVPLDILSRLEGGEEGDAQPMLIYFYDEDQTTTQQQDEWVNEVATDYPGLIDVVSYDIGAFVETDANGAITLSNEEALIEAEGQPIEYTNAQKAARLTGDQWLDVSFTPYIVFTDQFGYITYRIRGPVDSKILEGQVLRATE